MEAHSGHTVVINLYKASKGDDDDPQDLIPEVIEPPPALPASPRTAPQPASPRQTAPSPYDLTRWAPIPSPSFSSSPYPHLPASAQKGRTSFPIASVTKQMKELEYSVSRLISPAVLKSFLAEARGRANFRQFLMHNYPHPTAVAQLDLYTDLQLLEEMTERTRVASRAVRDVYFSQDTRKGTELPPTLAKAAIHSLRDAVNVAPLERPSQHLLESLYANEFQSYVKNRLVSSAAVKLGAFGGLSKQERAGLGDAFCLSNPRLPDCPIVLCSPAFCTITGYSAADCVGRNCRFLQGAATSPSSVASVRNAIAAEEGFTQLLLNYRADGQPFWNLLCCIPLHDDKGNLTYFIGGQTNVTGAISSSEDLSVLLLADTALDAESANGFTPEVQAGIRVGVKGTPATTLQPDLAVKSLETTFSPSLVPITSPRKDRFRHLFSFSGKDKPILAKGGEPTSPDLSSALQEFSAVPASLDTRIHDFSFTYNKLILFRRSNRELLAVTPGLLPENTPVTSLLHQDLLGLLEFASQADKKAWVPKIEHAIEAAECLAIPCRLRRQEAGIKTPYGVFYISPLQDRGSEFVAFCGVFGEAPSSPSCSL